MVSMILNRKNNVSFTKETLIQGIEKVAKENK